MFVNVATALCLLFTASTMGDLSDIGLNPAEMIANHGYPSETHEITTEDGYILTYHRIPSNSTTNKKVVLLMHGYTSSSASYVTMGPSRGLSYLLADAGYDVWLGNTRGNAFSRRHISIDPDLDGGSFYNFTWHEIGVYDLPNAIDYILDVTGEPSLQYVGHSQGTTAFFVLTSTRPEYNSKIRLASLMAAPVYLEHIPNLLVKDLAKYIDEVEVLLERYKIWEDPFTKGRREFVRLLCANPFTDELCDIIYHLKFPKEQVPEEELAVVYTNSPSNAGMKQLVHFGQQARDGKFRYFDYGVDKNLEIYGTESPPEYDLSKISTPVAFYYSTGDDLVSFEDEQKLISLVPNVVNDYVVPDDFFTHTDFIFAKDIVSLLYDELISVMNEY